MFRILMMKKPGFLMGKCSISIQPQWTTRWKIISSRCLSIVIVLCNDIFLWSTDTTIYPIFFIENNLSCVVMTSLDWTLDTVLSCSALFLQLSFRLYLKYKKKMNESNDLITIKLLVFVMYASLILAIFPLPSNSKSFAYNISILLIYSSSLIIRDLTNFSWKVTQLFKLQLQLFGI